MYFTDFIGARVVRGVRRGEVEFGKKQVFLKVLNAKDSPKSEHGRTVEKRKRELGRTLELYIAARRPLRLICSGGCGSASSWSLFRLVVLPRLWICNEEARNGIISVI